MGKVLVVAAVSIRLYNQVSGFDYSLPVSTAYRDIYLHPNLDITPVCASIW